MIRPYRIPQAALAGLFLGLFSWSGGEEQGDPAARWVTVYGWSQTGDRLAAADQWALAMGSYIESFQQIKALADDYPAFEPELIAYRTGKLEETIAATEDRLSADEHATMMKYLDFIESLELGQEQRFSNQYEEALTTLDMAKSLLDELIGKKPAEFRAAIDSQYLRLEDSIAWLSSQIDYKAVGRRAAYVGDNLDRGTTRFVKVADLPSSEDGAFASGMLFPGSLAAKDLAGFSGSDPIIDRAEGERTTPVGDAAENTSGAAVRFRMNSRQKREETGGKGAEVSR